MHEQMSPAWHARGTYFEACNCDAVCPCRKTNGAAGGRSTHGVCDFALSWQIEDGAYAAVALDGLTTVMVGAYEDRDQWTPWRVALLVDERADATQAEALAAIFLGRAGGTPLVNFTKVIGEVCEVRPARISLDHRDGHERIEVDSTVSVAAAGAAAPAGAVSCGIPGHDRPGTELHVARLAVREDGFDWSFSGVCGFRTTFDYRSDD
ncbi:MAG: hypothetical protein NVS9B1_24690 [Candidatus Dormibacteraceae bacterium]